MQELKKEIEQFFLKPKQNWQIDDFDRIIKRIIFSLGPKKINLDRYIASINDVQEQQLVIQQLDISCNLFDYYLKERRKYYQKRRSEIEKGSI